MKAVGSSRGFALVAVLLFIALTMSLLGAYYVITRIELASTKYSRDSVSGFYAAEAGLNIRAEQVRQLFVGYNRPSGVSPDEDEACSGTNLGTGDYACQGYTFGKQSVKTYITEDASNPISTTIPLGERYQNLNAQEYRYTISSVASDSAGNVSALLQLRFKSRLVPMFQFVAFYDKDLEILPGAAMNLSGPVHTNGDLYLNTENALNISGQVTAAGELFRGRKNTNVCNSKPVGIRNPVNLLYMVPACSTRVKVTDVTAWNEMVQIGVPKVTVPSPEALDPTPSAVYFSKADLRLALMLDTDGNPITSTYPSGVVVLNANGLTNVDMTNTLHAGSCGGLINGLPVGNSNSFYNNREGKFIRMLEVDLRALLDCLHQTSWLGVNTLLSDSSEGGIILHLSVSGPSSAVLPNAYGVRVRNSEKLQSTISGAPQVQGVTIVTNQAFYSYGNFNSTSKIPAAILSDSFNVLSGSWDDANSQDWSLRIASSTTINSAVLSGTDSTGNLEGTGGQQAPYNGGMENYPRLHEKWGGKTLTYRGSFVSLNTPRHVNGTWVYGSPQYEAPTRNWDYDTDFNDAANLPPLSPRFVYLRQELFVRSFEQ